MQLLESITASHVYLKLNPAFSFVFNTPYPATKWDQAQRGMTTLQYNILT